MLFVKPDVGRSEVEAINSVKRHVHFLTARFDRYGLQQPQAGFAARQQRQFAAVLQQRLGQQTKARRATVKINKVTVACVAFVPIFGLIFPGCDAVFHAEALVD